MFLNNNIQSSRSKEITESVQYWHMKSVLKCFPALRLAKSSLYKHCMKILSCLYNHAYHYASLSLCMLIIKYHVHCQKLINELSDQEFERKRQLASNIFSNIQILLQIFVLKARCCFLAVF